MRELFIYYRIDAADAAPARRAVESMHERLRRLYPGLAMRLLVRDGEGSPSQTWMETYARPGSAGGVDDGLEASIAAEAVQWASLVAGPRHVEAFIARDDEP